jgi:hypothetical protein
MTKIEEGKGRIGGWCKLIDVYCYHIVGLKRLIAGLIGDMFGWLID